MNSNRDSFDHRFGDDLFELIISYLTVKDKIRYESVSKRFQRFVFNKQKILVINFSHGMDTTYRLNLRHLLSYRRFEFPQIVPPILKKMPKITEIRVDLYLSQVLATIIDNCHHLTRIHFTGREFDSEKLKRFCQRFGQQLSSISFEFSEAEVIPNFKDFPNLLSITNPTISQLKNEFLPKRLVQIKGLRLSDEEDFQLFSGNKLQNLKYLEIFLKTNSIPNSMKELSQLKNLINLSIGFPNNYFSSHIISKTIELIAKNCLNLQFLQINASFLEDNDFNSKQCFDSLTHFSGLKKLVYIIRQFKTVSAEERITDLMPLKNCKNLFSLFLLVPVITDEVIDGIHLIVPQLRQLALFSPHLSDKSLESIGRLKSLTHLRIESNRYKGNVGPITNEGIISLFNVWKRRKFVRIYDKKLVEESCI